MKQVEVEYLDGKITVVEQEENTFKELVKILGSEEEVCSEVTSNIRYRHRHPRIYKKVCVEVLPWCPKPIKKEETVNGKKKVIYVSDIEHARAAYDKDPERVTEIFTRLGKTEPLFVADRGPGGRISQGALDAANGMIAEGTERVSAVVSFIEETISGYKVPREEDESVSCEALARGIQALNKHLEKQAKQKTAATLAMVGK